MYNLAAIHEAIAASVPERECLVFGERRFSWAELTERTRRLSAVLRAHGLGCHRPRSELQGWESGQDHVACYLYNGNEYLEAMLGAYKARCAPFNVNYRYVEEELLYLFDNADARAIVYHASFAPLLEALRPKLSGVRLWLQVEDGSGHGLLPGALDYEDALAAVEPSAPEGLSPDDLYILYTGGTTGMPKGVLWRQEDIFLGALASARTPATLEGFGDLARERAPLRALPIPPFMHGAAHWVVFNMWSLGATVFVQSQTRRLDPDDVWSTVEREKIQVLTIVGDAFARPLFDQLLEKDYDLSSLFLMTSGGAIFSADLKQRFLERLPQLRISDNLGSSESGSQATFVSKLEDKASGGEGATAQTGRFDLAGDSVVLREDLSGLETPGSGRSGWLARYGHVPLGYYKDEKKTAATFPVIDGVRYSVPGDRATLEADGDMRLLGRDSVTINSGGEKIFAEEVELALKHHPEVYDVVVVGTPSERWGQQVTAVVQLRDGRSADDDALRDVAREHIAAYKLPKAIVRVAKVERAPSGKADYRWARETAEEAID